MSEIKLSGQVILEYLQKFPETSSLCLARLIYRENKALYTNTEHIRTIIRYYRGASGKLNREKLKDKSYEIRKHILFSV